MSRILFFSIGLSLFTLTAFADEIFMANGDRLTGSILRSDSESLVLSTEYAGQVKIRWSAITALNSDGPLHVTLKDARVLAGRVGMRGADLEVRESGAEAVIVPKTEVTALRSRDEQSAYQAEIERLRDPRLWDLWAGTADFGLSSTRGNSDTLTLTLGSKASRTTERDKLSVYFTSLLATRTLADIQETTANAIRGGARYELGVSDRLFAFGFADFDADEFQDLDLRNVLGGGFGWHVKRSERLFLEVFGGGSLNQEFFTNDVTRRSGEFLMGEDFTYKLSDWMSFTERIAFYPNLSNPGEYRLTFDSSATARVNSWLSWHITLSDRSLTNPKPGKERNDLLISTGIRLNLGEEGKSAAASKFNKLLRR